MRMFVACRLPHVALRAARRLPFAADLPVLSIVACRLAPGAWHSVWPLPSAPSLSALSLAVSPWRLLLSVRVALSAAFCERSLFLLSPHAESRCASYRRMSNLRVPRAALTPLKHTLHFAVTCVSRS